MELGIVAQGENRYIEGKKNAWEVVLQYVESIEEPLAALLKNIEEVSANTSLSVEQLLSRLAGKQVKNNRLVIKETGEIKFIDIDNIEWIKSAGSYVEIFEFGSTRAVLYRCSLKALIERLDHNEFVRIHRSTIIRRQEIAQMTHVDRGDYEITLKSGQSVLLSRNYRENLPEVFLQ